VDAIALVAVGLLVVLPFAFAAVCGLSQVDFLARLSSRYPRLAVEVDRAPSGSGPVVDRLTLRSWWVTPEGLRGERGLARQATFARAARMAWWVGLFAWPAISIGGSAALGADLVVGLALVPLWALTGPIALRHETVPRLPDAEAVGNASGNALAFYFLPALIVGAVVLALALGWAVSAVRG
jgi:hypothetical protein